MPDEITQLRAELADYRDQYARRRAFAAAHADYGDWEPMAELAAVTEHIEQLRDPLRSLGVAYP